MDLASLGALQGAAAAFGVELTPVGMADAGEIERGLAAFARVPNGGVIVVAGTEAVVHRELIAALATRYRLPSVNATRLGGSLISYGPVTGDQFRLAAAYIDRILKGEKPADLPVQVPTKYELVVNIGIAKALGLTVPPLLLTRADEVIE